MCGSSQAAILSLLPIHVLMEARVLLRGAHRGLERVVLLHRHSSLLFDSTKIQRWKTLFIFFWLRLISLLQQALGVSGTQRLTVVIIVGLVADLGLVRAEVARGIPLHLRWILIILLVHFSWRNKNKF